MSAPAGNVQAVVDVLIRRGQTVAVAESLTGGLLAATLVEVPGVSKTFRGGLVVYATDLKVTLAGVDPDLLARQGPVDPEVAAQLARGAAVTCGADWGLGTTGVAGPDPQDGVTVGTVFVGVAGPGRYREVRELQLDGDRATIRAQAVSAALLLLAEGLDKG
jgi:nicotinamide-nucleotide amidase